MATEAQPLYNFYHRYKWNEVDFATWQDGVVGLQRAAMEGLFAGAVMGGFDVNNQSGMTARVGAGLAVGPSGYLMVENNTTDLTFVAPVTNPRRDLIVIQPKLVNSTPITRPTSPFDTVYLKQLQDCEVVKVTGVESTTPEFPNTPAGAVVICGVRLQAGQSSITSDDCDFNKREIYGRNSDFQQNFGRYDDRLRPFRQDYRTLGIKPSQLVHPRSRAFSFVNRTMPSIWPKSAGVYNHADTFLNFQTGVLTGGDTTSAAFTPTIPSAGNFINCTIAIDTSDLLNVTYGVVGTRAQCLAGIKNQVTTVTAGSVGIPNNSKIIAIVTIGSTGGVNIDSLEYVDCRGTAAGGDTTIAYGSAGPVAAALPYTITTADRGRILNVDTTAASGTIQLPAPNTGVKFQVVDVGNNFNYLKARLLRNGTEKINKVQASYDLESSGGAWFVESDGVDWFVY